MSPSREMTSPGRRWLLDLGNSRLKCAPLDAQGRRGEVIILDLADAQAVSILLRQLGDAAPDDQVWLASVAQPARREALLRDLADAGFDCRLAQTRASLGRLRIAYADPSKLGIDRFLAMLAASERGDGPWLLVSAGSALTLDLLAADGQHLGGLIAPMPVAMHETLAARFVQLDVQPGRAMDFADNTADAIASGCAGAAIGLVERSLRRAQALLGVAPTLLLSGGGAALLHGIDHSPIELAPAIVLDGLARYARLQA